ncbi:ATP-binding protein [Lentzea tibetensis]|uniref:ATP-binding protein n=1 Tax=Lentzea tibetensis TaxID=2591470 RepID=UPI0016460744|nr:tetratricopeptide repeat protein [Lentzea tibetensis]
MDGDITGTVVQAGVIEGGVHIVHGTGAAMVVHMPPRQLPPSPATFTGRVQELELLPAGPGADVTVISAIGGMGGVGKTWLALHWAHRAAEYYPDGQLFVDLNGFDPLGRSMAPEVAVRGFLVALGVDPAAIPIDPHAQTALYRTLVADRRMLIVLDNARDAAQVIPLLPGSSTCTVLITSRDRMHSLSTTRGARTLKLDALSDQEARDLLARHLGVGRLEREPDAVTDLLGYCAGLPLALGIVAGRAAAHPDFPLAALADELRQARLQSLDMGDLVADVTAVLSWSCAGMNAEQTRVFELLGQTPSTDLSIVAAANLTGSHVARTRTVLRALERMSLLDEHLPGRYRMHDLVRLFAAQQSSRDSVAQRRLADFYLHTAHAGNRLQFPQFRSVTPPTPAHDVIMCPLPDEEAASAWFDVEHLNLLAVQELAVEQQWHAVVWHIAQSANNTFRKRAHLHDMTLAWERALSAAKQLGAYFVGMAHQCLGIAFITDQNRKMAMDHLHRALAIFVDIEDLREQSYAHRDLAAAYGVYSDDHKQALAHAIRARDLSRTLDEPVQEATALNLIGQYQSYLGDHAEGAANCQLALKLFRSQHYRMGESATLDSLGLIAHHSGRYADALEYYRQAMAIIEDDGIVYAQPTTLDNIARTYVTLGQREHARVAWRHSLALYRAQGRADEAEQVLRQLDDL